MNYIVSIHATQLKESTFDALWENEYILDGENTGSVVLTFDDAESIQDIWATMSNGVEFNNEEANSTFNAGLLKLYNQGADAPNTIAFISEELVLSITVIEVGNA